MPPGNITRVEAARRSSCITVLDYRVELDLSTAPTELGWQTFKSVTRIEFHASARSQTWLDLIADSVESVRLNGSDLRTPAVAGRLELRGLDVHNVVEVVAHCRYSTTGEGLHRFRDPADSQTYLYSQFATAEARRVFACFEQPDMKAPLTLTVLAPEGWEVVANSPLRSLTSDGGTSRWLFEPTAALPTYVMAVIAGPYHRVSSGHQGAQRLIPLGLLVRASMAKYLDAAELFELTSAGLAHFERIFGMAYPFAKYDQVFVPEFNLGAMENPGAVTLREDSFIFRSRVPDSAREMRANVILHEMAHMWFGDLVTMRWWDDLWLNESFAEWCGHDAAVTATPFVDSWVTFAMSGKARAARADQLPSTHPVACDMVDLDAVYLNFDGITYAKGASVLRQLVAWVGLEPFLRGVAEYFAAHAWGNTTFEDLLQALSSASGRDLTSWASLWLQSVGVNTIRLQVSTQDQRYRAVTLAQEPATAPEGVAPILRPHRVAVGVYRWAGADGARRLVRCDRYELDLTGSSAEVAQLAGAQMATFLLPNDDDLTFAKIRLDPFSQAAAFDAVSRVADPLARALIWGSAWDMVRDAELPVHDYLEMMAKALGEERNTSLLTAVYATLGEAIGRYLPAGRIDTAQVHLAEALLGHARRCEPGSDVQLLHVRAYVRHARAANQLEVVRRLLQPSGQVPVAGLVVDQELRWQAVTRLVALGAAPAELVTTELNRDPTMAGQRAAAFALAARPSHEAKELAWRQALASTAVVWPASGNTVFGVEDQCCGGAGGPSEATPGGQTGSVAHEAIAHPLSNALLQATVAGFGYPEHASLVARYSSEYFRIVEQLWQSGSPNNATEVARGLFPAGDVRFSTLSQARQFLAKNGLAPGLARLVAEGAAGLARALRVQAVSDLRSR